MSLSEADRHRLHLLMEKYCVNDPRKLCDAINKVWSDIYYHSGSERRVVSLEQKMNYVRKLSDISEDERVAAELLNGII